MRLCRLDTLRDKGALSFSVEVGGREIEGFVLWRDGGVFAYLNRCPHSGAPLNWAPDVFLTPEGTHIQCALHGALFRPEDGRCVYGPCVGEALTPLRVEVTGEMVVLLEQSVLLAP